MKAELLLTAKLTRPRAARLYLPRPKVSALLREGLSRRLTALIATAGHGKSTAMAHFLDEVGLPSLWIQLDARDSDLNTFLPYLAVGVRQQLKGGSHLWRALEAGREVEDPLPLLIADLREVDQEHLLVLDDFHLIDRESPIVPLISGLLQYADERTHFYICSRTPLPFSTARLKVIQEAGEITEEELRFTREETRAFFTSAASIELEEEQLDQICHLTEGWTAALVLLASGLRRRGSLGPLMSGGLPSDLFAYLAEEVFHGLPPALQHFMEESSILDVLSPTACDDILERQDSAAMLGQLSSSGLMLIQLDSDSFRYHHLLQRFLQERLKTRETGDFARLHRQAGDWFLEREEPEEAVKHYLAGGWVQEAAGLVEELAPLWLRTRRLERLQGLLSHLPPSIKGHYPWITLVEARRLLHAGQPDHAVGMGRMALRAFEEYGDRRGIVQAHLLISEALSVRWEPNVAREELAMAEAAMLPEYRYEQALLLQRRAALAYLSNMAPETFEADLRAALAIFVELGDLQGEASVSDTLGITRARQGDFVSAVKFLERSTTLMRSMGEPDHELGINLAWAYNIVGRFREAAAICQRAFQHSSRKKRRAHAGLNLMHAYTCLGEFAQAAAVGAVTNSLAEELGDVNLKTDLTVELSTLYRLSGQSQASLPFVSEAIQLARRGDQSHLHLKPSVEAVLLHLFHTGNAGSAAKLAERTLARIENKGMVLDSIILTLALAVAQFRLTRTESRPDAVRTLQDGLTECQRRQAEFFTLHEWPLALSAVIYGLAYDVQSEYCMELIRFMQQSLPAPVLQAGIPLMEAEARLLPAAWQALPDEKNRTALESLLTPQDRKRVVGLATGPAPLQIQVLGPLVVTLNGEPVDVKALKRRKSGQLLVVLVEAEGPLNREQVIDRLWPDLDPAAADTSLRVSLHHLRRLLEPHLGGKQKSRYIHTEGGLIWLSRQPELAIDLDAFRELMRLAEEARDSGNLAEAANHYESACRLYRGDLAADEPYALDDLRQTWHMRYLAALDWLAEYYWHEAQETSRAIDFFQRRLAVDETCEQAHQALMRIYIEAGQVARAHQQYLACKAALKSQLGVAPSRSTELLRELALSLEAEGNAQPENRSAGRHRRHEEQ